VNVPIALKRNRRPDPYTGAAGDATFPNHIYLVSYTHRFGGPASAPREGARPGVDEAPSKPAETGAPLSAPPLAACVEPGFDSSAGAP